MNSALQLLPTLPRFGIVGFLDPRDFERSRFLEPEDVVETDGQSELRLDGIAFAVGDAGELYQVATLHHHNVMLTFLILGVQGDIGPAGDC